MLKKEKLIQFLLKQLEVTEFISKEILQKYLEIPHELEPFFQKDDFVKYKIGNVLNYFESKEAIQPIIDKIKQTKKVSGRNRLIDALGYFKERICAEFLRELLKNNNYKKSHYKILISLSKIGFEEDIKEIIKLLSEEDFTLRFIAIETIIIHNRVETVSKLSEIAINDSNKLIRFKSLQALRELNGKKSIRKLKNKLKQNKVDDEELFFIAYTLASIEGMNSIGMEYLRNQFIRSNLKDEQEKLYDDLHRKMMSGEKKVKVKKTKKTQKLDQIDHPTVFISYSWDSKQHKDWVRKLTDDLLNRGVYVSLDQYNLMPGKDIADFIDEGLKSDFVLVICTKGYMEKLTRSKGGVKFEDSILKAQVLKGKRKDTVIPIIRESSDDIPPYLSGIYGIDMSNNRKYKEKLEEIIRRVYNKPKHIPPELGEPPKEIFE